MYFETEYNNQADQPEQINTGGGIYVGGNVVTAQGDFTGRDSIGGDKIEGDQIHGDKIEGDKVLGDKITIGQQTIINNNNYISDKTLKNYKLESELVEKIDRFVNPLHLRILLTTSELEKGKPEESSVNIEKAYIEETLSKLRIQSEKFKIEIYHFDKNGFDNGTNQNVENQNNNVVFPDLTNFDCIIFIIWRNLGFLQEGIWSIESLYQQAQKVLKEKQTKPRLILYRNTNTALDEEQPSFREKRLHKSQVQDFFRRIESQVEPYKNIGELELIFENDIRNWLRDVIQATPIKTDGELDQAEFSAPFDNPFRGLERYDIEHSASFFGRFNEVNELCTKLISTPGFLAVIGPSGSGKSSLVRAGLLHRLQNLDAIPGSKDWPIVDVTISDNLFLALAQSLLRSTYIPKRSKFSKLREEELANKLRVNFAEMESLVAEILYDKPATTRLVLFIDQFEELFTLINDENQRKWFIDFLVRCATSKRIQVIQTMRSEYYHHCLLYQNLKELFEYGVYPLSTPTYDALFSMITRPVLFNGFRFEDATFPLDILQDTGISSGALPLMSYALSQLAEHSQTDKVLTRQLYKELGGVKGVIQKQADAAVASLKDEEHFGKHFNDLFRHLVTGGEEGQPTKKSVVLNQLTEGSHRLASVLIEARLLQSDINKEDEPILEIAHEALLSNWDLLVDWISERRNALMLIHRVENAAAEWSEAKEEAKKRLEKLNNVQQIDLEMLKIAGHHLWPHERLVDVYTALDLLGRKSSELPSTVQAFIRPETERIIDELQVQLLKPQDRASRGDRLAILADPRPGVGLISNDILDIVWCRVPSGQVKLQNFEELFNVQEFYIAKYPVTLAQFNAFTQPQVELKDSPYVDKTWWVDLEINPFEHKPYPQSPDTMINRPAEWVSWYQAIAFCRWASQKLGYTVRLPTEWEWQQAATGGLPNHRYPWGDEWNAANASNKSGHGQLVAVGLYPQGRSPVGAMDMSGNVYEWCMNKFDQIRDTSLHGNEKRTTRGGAWFAFQLEASETLTVYHRLEDHTKGYNERNDRIRAGFRLACDHPPIGSKIESNADLFPLKS